VIDNDSCSVRIPLLIDLGCDNFFVAYNRLALLIDSYNLLADCDHLFNPAFNDLLLCFLKLLLLFSWRSLLPWLAWERGRFLVNVHNTRFVHLALRILGSLARLWLRLDLRRGLNLSWDLVLRNWLGLGLARLLRLGLLLSLPLLGVALDSLLLGLCLNWLPSYR
jgi:hypothetical protein